MTITSAIITESSTIRSAFMFRSLVLEKSIAFPSVLLKRLVKSLILLSSVFSLFSPVAPLDSVVTENVKSLTSDQQTVSKLSRALCINLVALVLLKQNLCISDFFVFVEFPCWYLFWQSFINSSLYSM